MKKISWATHKSLFGQIATTTCIAAASAGVVFGIAGATFKVNFINFNEIESRVSAAQSHNFYSQNISTEWNVSSRQPYAKQIINDPTWWTETHGDAKKWNEVVQGIDVDPNKMDLSKEYSELISKEAIAERYKYAALVIDGATHTPLDRSFNQSLYNGMVNFKNNIPTTIRTIDEAQIYKPAQDTTTEFVNVYRALAKKARALCLAGFNHVTPLNTLGHTDEQGIFRYADPALQDMGFMLIDGDIPNNQNLASILFRSDEPAFLSTLATAMYLYNNLHMYHDKHQDLKVACYGGTAVPGVVTYMGGYQRGVEFFNYFILWQRILKKEGADYINNIVEEEYEYFGYFNKLLEYSKYKDEVEQLKQKPTKTDEEVESLLLKLYDEYSLKMIKLGDFDTYFSGSFTAGEAIGITKQLLNRGASAIISIAGPQVLDTATEIMNQNSNCAVIGVDCAIESSDSQRPLKNSAFVDQTKALDGTSSAQAGNVIKFSAVKDMTSVATNILLLAANGKNWDNSNAEPWNSHTKLPTFADEEVLNPNDYLEIVETDENNFRVIGFKKNDFPKNAKVLSIPMQMEKNGKTIYLTQIGAESGDTPTYPFNSENLKQFVEFRMTNSDLDNKVLIKDKAFNFETDNKNSGFLYFDLSRVRPASIKFEELGGELLTKPFYKMVTDNESRAFNRGIFDIGSTSNLERKKIYEGLTTGIPQWGIVEADPLKATASFGFRTCGNIENGLISLSWDGWYYLLEALKHVVLPNQGGAATFMQLWRSCAEQYVYSHVVPELFAKRVVTDKWQDLSTFNTDSVFKKYYNHMMSILGDVLKITTLVFPKDMTIALDDNNKPIKPKEDVRMSILDWLTLNMYFIP